MCGFLGIAGSEACADPELLSLGIEKLHHRGPDDGGIWIAPDRRFGLAHRRLAVMDLSPAGHQPLLSPGGRKALVYNGEIYNCDLLRDRLSRLGVTFSGHCDTEVVLAAYQVWGVDCIHEFRGMFALAIIDCELGTVFLARDRIGEKPLFFHREGRILRFASTLSALLADRSLERRVDLEALDLYLAIGHVPGERCMLKGFNKLPAGHAAQYCIESGAWRVWRYWELPAGPDSSVQGQSLGELADQVEAVLEDSVRSQLVADVPVGVLLSGGVDSSLIAAMAARACGRIKTFTVRFPDHAGLDEAVHARRVASHFGTDHAELDADMLAAELLPELARHFDEPVADSSMIPTLLLCRMVRSQCKVALGGDGGDELFGGYRHYSRLLWLERRFGAVPLAMRRPVAWLAEEMLASGMKGRNWLSALGVDLKLGLPHVAALCGPRLRRGLMGGRCALPLTAERILDERVPAHHDLLQRATRMDFQDYLADDLLVKIDRASMAASLEVRSPMLDHRLVELAFGKIPSEMKASPDQRKIVLKKLCSRILPKGFDLHRKQGFSIPLAQWLKGGVFRDLFLDVLRDADCIFDRRCVEGLILGQGRGRNNGERLFALVFFELWRREHGVSF
ncbi:MAG: asparagine synthase (glutamine-hydrolyzing) [Rhodocyclaceae bacterium]|nr:asparagine synthase (glutamine-hydrolyzing) [Rhodocyclaceae bacterium]